MAQLISITSEALQATVRRLLPSQQGFGEDLQATNVVTPIIDLTPSAEGSETRQDLQSALAFDSCTAFDVVNTTVTLANSAGFWRFYGNYTAGGSSTALIGRFNMTDGSTTKTFWESSMENTYGGMTNFDFIVFLRSGDSVNAASNNTRAQMHGSYRQIADINGVLVNPGGFTPQ